MIRAVLLVTLTGILALVLYVPATYPPERLLMHVRAEHLAAAHLWGASPSASIMARALKFQDSASGVSRPALTTPPPISGPLDEALSAEMAAANRRLFSSTYFRSLDALFLLAAFRLATLLEWLPVLLVFPIAALLDGGVVRRVRAKEFRQHDPEMFAMHVCLAIITACGTVAACFAPVTLHPMLLPCVPLLLAASISRAVASFHRGI